MCILCVCPQVCAQLVRPLLAMSHLLQRQVKQLGGLLVRKDAEIQDFRENGATLSRGTYTHTYTVLTTRWGTTWLEWRFNCHVPDIRGLIFHHVFIISMCVFEPREAADWRFWGANLQRGLYGKGERSATHRHTHTPQPLQPVVQACFCRPLRSVPDR